MAQNLLAPATSALPSVLVSKQLENTATTQYTGPAASAVKIAKAILCNTTGVSVTVSLSVVKATGTAGTANRILSAYPLAAGDTTTISELEGLFLGPGDFISTTAGAATAVTLVLSGVVFS